MQQILENQALSCDPPWRRPCPRRIGVLAMLVVLVAWGSSASAGPGVIIADRVEALAAPSREANVVTELGHGAQVCVLDATNHTGLLLHRLGWLALRLPGGVGYVPVETVDQAAPAPDVVDCGASSAPVAETQASAPSPPQEPPSGGRTLAPSSPRTSEPVAARPALLAGGFLPLHPARFVLGVGTGMAWLDKQAAEQHQIGDAGITVNTTLGLLIQDIVMLSAAFTFAFPSDQGSFSQDVVLEMGGGDPHSADSSLTVVSYSVAAGLRTPFWALGSTQNGWVGGALFAQYGTAGFHGSRSIDHCVDCRKDDLDMTSGTFWLAGFDLLVPGRTPKAAYGVTISYQHFLAGTGFSDEVRVGFSCWLN